MRQTYLRCTRRKRKRLPKRNALRSELTWTHYRALLCVEEDNARTWYMEEAIRAGWSSRQLEREIELERCQIEAQEES